MSRRTSFRKSDKANQHMIGVLSAVSALPSKMVAGLLRLRQARRSAAKRKRRP